MEQDMKEPDCINIKKCSFGNKLQFYSPDKWFDGSPYVIIKYDGEKLRFIKCYLEIPKGALKIAYNRTLKFSKDIPAGKYRISYEESNEDELIAYLSAND